MIPIQLKYAAPTSLDDAVQLLSENQNTQILAGGHSLLTALKLGHIAPSMLIDLVRIQGLHDIRIFQDTNNKLEIGAMATYAQVAITPEICQSYSVLVEAINNIGDTQIRNWGRMGDIFAYRDLACDLLAAALVLEATFNTFSHHEARAIPADRFIISTSNTDLKPGEIVTSINFPPLTKTGSAYKALKQPASSYTLCGVAARVELAASGLVSKCCLAVTGVAIAAKRLYQAEAQLKGKAPIARNIAAVIDQITENLVIPEEQDNEPPAIYGSVEYRTHLVRVLTERTLNLAVERANMRSHP